MAIKEDLIFIFDIPSDAPPEEWSIIEEALGTAQVHPNELEQVLVNRLSGWRPNVDAPLLEYLMKCYGQLNKISPKADQRLVAECKYFIMSYSGLVLLIPSMFQEGQEELERLGPGLLAKTLIERYAIVPTSFVADLIARYETEESGLIELMEGIFGYLKGQFSSQKILNPAGNLFAVLEYLISFKTVADLLPRLSIWWPADTKPAEIGSTTLLGSIFSVIPTGDTINELLPMREQSNLGQVANAYTALRMACNGYAGQIHSFLLKGIKSSPILKEAIISFLASTALANRDRAKMRYDPRAVSPDGLVMNIFRVLVKFCDPFLGLNNPKADLIDLSYYETSNRIPIDDMTKINMEDSVYADYKKQVLSTLQEAKQPNFISEMYYLALYYFRISYVTQITSMSTLERYRRELRDLVDRLKADLSKNPANMLLKMNLKRAQDQLSSIETGQRLNEMALLDPEFVEAVYLVINLMLGWILKLANAREGRVPDQPEKRFLSLPEHVIETISEVVLFISRSQPQFWSPSKPIEPLVQFLVAFLDRPDYIKNPFIRSKFIDIMHGWTTGRSTEQIFDLYPVMVNSLSGKLMRFYIEVERTGASSQFYDKFNIRFCISMIIRCLWDHPIYRVKIKEASEDRENFIQFINFILNDVSFLLDEAMMKLVEIHNYQEEAENGVLAKLPAEEQKAKAESFKKAESMCQAYAQLGGETLNMLAYLTKLIQEPFLQDEVIDHFAAMLNYNLVQLAGPKCRELRVKEPEKYHFEPRAWLGNVIQVFLNFMRKPAFLKALSRDGRSFQPETFHNAAALMGRLGLGTEQDVTAFRQMIERVQGIRQEEQMDEEDLGDIPDEFLDPLMATLMEDPVLLTTSGTIVDRKTIVAHLLNNKIDPFNRMPITMEQVIPDTELKARIDRFIADKRNK